jgi:hypothetical protein
MDWRHPTWHEAGHVVVGLHLGFLIESVKAVQGKLGTVCHLNSQERTNEERYEFLTGGIAGEQYGIGNYESDPCRRDQEQIVEFGGGLIETYLPAALEIVSQYDRCIRQFQKEIMMKTVARTMEMSFGGTNSFIILTQSNIGRIWEDYQPPLFTNC